MQILKRSVVATLVAVVLTGALASPARAHHTLAGMSCLRIEASTEAAPISQEALQVIAVTAAKAQMPLVPITTSGECEARLDVYLAWMDATNKGGRSVGHSGVLSMRLYRLVWAGAHFKLPEPHLSWAAVWSDFITFLGSKSDDQPLPANLAEMAEILLRKVANARTKHEALDAAEQAPARRPAGRATDGKPTAATSAPIQLAQANCRFVLVCPMRVGSSCEYIWVCD
jgi:hypothetical protein